jgi:hypothetical protein
MFTNVSEEHTASVFMVKLNECSYSTDLSDCAIRNTTAYNEMRNSFVSQNSPSDPVSPVTNEDQLIVQDV